MLPYFTVFGKDIYTYGLMVAVGILFCYFLFRFTSKKRKNVDNTILVIMGLWSALGAVIGAHIMYAIANYQKLWFAITHLDRVFESFDKFILYGTDIFGGMVFYGGLIGAVTAAYIYLKVKKYDYGNYGDILAPCIPLFHAFGRIGCFLGGCCYGIESEFGFTFTNSLSPLANGVNRFPVQLLESFVNLVITAVLVYLLLKPVKKGAVFWSYGLIYPICRFCLEFLRGDVIERGFMGPLSTSQWISLILFVLSLIMMIRIYYKDKNNETHFPQTA